MEVSGKQALYRAFWTLWIERVHTGHPQWSRATRPPRESWFSTTTGISGVTYYTSFTKQGLSSELVFESPDAAINTTRFEALETHRQELAAAYGGALEWQSLPGRKATRIAEYLPDADVTMQEEWDRYLKWLLDRQNRLRDALAAVGGALSLAGE